MGGAEGGKVFVAGSTHSEEPNTSLDLKTLRS